MIEKPPLRMGSAAAALARCASRTVLLLIRGQVRQPTDKVGYRLHFADGTATEVYRETILERPPPTAPAVLVVEFRLRWMHGERAHALFRLESELNTVLFIGFPGFVSKLWCRHDERGVYRGFYEWDDPGLAEAYVRALWWVLALVSIRESIHYAILAGWHRDEVLDDPHIADQLSPGEKDGWWRLSEVDAALHD